MESWQAPELQFKGAGTFFLLLWEEVISNVRSLAMVWDTARFLLKVGNKCKVPLGVYEEFSPHIGQKFCR